MRHGFTGSILIAALVSLAAITTAAQTSAIARTPDGRPNLQGIWQVLTPRPGTSRTTPRGWDAGRAGRRRGQRHSVSALGARGSGRTLKSGDGRSGNERLPAGVPRIMYMPFPFQIFQTPTHVAMTFEYAQGVRIVYTNGTPHPRGPIEWWLGDSRGRWEGDTLVVDAIHFTDQTWFDRAGNFHSEALHLVERYTMTGPITSTTKSRSKTRKCSRGHGR